ncbi:Rpn family recombination-promoting nuclease/putative transposase [Halorhodospira neutriphila]|uniref:Transposase n=1 Tax=Halorhodospira neutriphila TaxID=168379 RepID=A0ABS1E1F4_9GAMM|nr:Rpn family recombination-promoting nuclease/putative transposase [Halorhodospira neutriphila]MBK1725610.1 transposase [Halorhodospira neutriphila]
MAEQQQHDPAYKRLFSQPEMIRELLVEYVHEDWVRELDFATLEKQNGSYATEDYRGRHDDVIWRVRWGEDWLYVYLLLEFQSGIDRFMAVRMLTYVGLLYQDLIAQGKLTADGLLPPVLPMVLYNGQARWSAATDIEPLIERIPGGLERYRPQMRYLLLDEGALLAEERSPALRSLVHALFRLEYSRSPQEMLSILGTLGEWLHQPEQRRLRREFAVWVQRVLLRRRRANDDEAEPDGSEVQDLEEVQEMLAERISEWEKEWEQRGRKEGRAAMLLRQIERKFGPQARADLQARVERATASELETWADRILEAERPEELFDSE